MEINPPVFPVLEAEIAKKGIKKQDIAAKLGITPRALSQKLVGKTEFMLGEALYIHSIFHDVPFEKLFQKNIPCRSGKGRKE